MKFQKKLFSLKNSEIVELESAVLSDADTLWAFGHLLSKEHEFQAMYHDEFTIKPEDEPKFIKENEDHPLKLALVARANGRVIAMCNLMPISRLRKMSHILSTSIGIIKEYRNQNLGQILIGEAIAVAKSTASIEKLELRVLSTNARAISLYKRMGFTEAGRLRNEFKMGVNEYCDDIIMELHF